MRQPVHILLVEDDEIDVMSVRRALARNRLSNPLHVAGNGLEALEMLRGHRPDAILPQLRRFVLLDLNMPRMGGVEFLKRLRADPELRETQVIVLTTSDEERDRTEVHNLNVAGYLLKPMSSEALMKIVGRMEDECLMNEDRFVQDRPPPSEGGWTEATMIGNHG